MNKWFRAALVAVVALLVGMVLGANTDLLPERVRDALVGEERSAPEEVRDEIEDNYFRGVDRDELEDKSPRAMIRYLRKRDKDRFSHYFNRKQFEQFRQATSGAFSGVGLSVNEIKRGLRVTTVFEDSPAEEAGIKEGDIVTAVDGRELAGVDAQLATGLIKGAAGTEVTLTVEPVGGGGPEELTMRREQINVPVVDGRMVDVDGKQVAYVQLAGFTPGVHAKLREEIERLDEEGAEGLILDLRGNGGGLLEEAVLTGSLFVEDGVIVSTDGRTQEKQVYNAVGEALEPRPTVVLINGDSASAAEILVAAMQENDLATVVGGTSFGKGVFQQVIPLEAGGGLDLTVGEYFTSDGTSLAGKGVEPDVPATDDPNTEPDEGLAGAREALAPLLAATPTP